MTSVRGEASFETVVAFHGHRCPGLAIGYRMARAALSRLAAIRASDEELVAVVENDACGVDALQVLSGCTFGKGNLRHVDHGKSAYTLFDRTSGKGVRVVFAPCEAIASIGDRNIRIDTILAASESDLLRVETARIGMPGKARIHPSVRCWACGESVMEMRTRRVDGDLLCIPCVLVRESA